MKRYHVATAIAAPPDAVWAILTDGSQYPVWDPGVERFEGRIAPGETIKVYTTLRPGKAFPVQVAVFEPPQRMVWSSGLPLGLFKGERTFTLTPAPDGATAFAMQEVFTGLLLPLIGRTIPDLTPTFEAFAAALKARAEAAS